MLPEQRRQRIVTLLGTRSMVRADALACHLGVSLETIRRDLTELERQGEVNRVYGGATRAPSLEQVPLTDRLATPSPVKRAIGRLAISLLQPGQTVLFGVGSTVVEAAKALPAGFAGQALTNSGPVAEVLCGHPSIRVSTADGRDANTESAGEPIERFISRAYADVALVGACGIHPQSGLTSIDEAESPVRRIMIRRSIERYVLAESQKLGRVAAAKVCDLADITGVVTDNKACRDIVDAIATRGVRVFIAHPE